MIPEKKRELAHLKQGDIYIDGMPYGAVVTFPDGTTRRVLNIRVTSKTVDKIIRIASK
jgi:hypothetical protein